MKTIILLCFLGLLGTISHYGYKNLKQKSDEFSMEEHFYSTVDAERAMLYGSIQHERINSQIMRSAMLVSRYLLLPIGSILLIAWCLTSIGLLNILRAKNK